MISFIVLHYITFNETKQCVDSILKIAHGQDFSVAIVDNGSKNNSGQKLIQEYKDVNKVTVLIQDENLGFSKGNNIGCQFAIQNFHPDFLYVVNNDTYIKDENTIFKIYQSYEKTRFDILGPYIWNTEKLFNHNANCENKCPNTCKEVSEELAFLKKQYRLLKKSSLLFYIRARLHKSLQTGYSLNGAALVFSKQYFDRFQTVFAEETFLYGEESLLTYRTNKYHLKMIYDENIKIYHNHSKSTQADNKKRKGKQLFQLEWIIKSRERLLEIYRDHLEI